MPAVKRSTDPEGADHFHNGDRETDWRMSPRPVLVVAIYVLMGALSFLGSFAYWALSDQIAQIKAAQHDQKWELLTTFAQRQGEQEKRLQQYEDAQREMQEQLRKLRAQGEEIKRLVSRGGR